MKNRILLGVLAFCMVVGMVPLTAFAQSHNLADTTVLQNQNVQEGEPEHTPQLTSTGTGDLVVTGDAGSYSWDDTNKVLTITGSAPLEISMVSTGLTSYTDTIVVQDGVTANIILNGVQIYTDTTSRPCAFEIAGSATANITIHGENQLYSGGNKAGLQVGETATLHILAASTGSLNARGGSNSAGIGGGEGSAGGNITISGGSVTAYGSSGAAGIGGGRDSAGGNITISGGSVTAEGIMHGAGIGAGAGGVGGTFKTQADGSATLGNAFIIASSISDTSEKVSGRWSGIIFENDSTDGQVYASPTLGADSIIPEDRILNVPNNTSITVPSGKTLFLPSGATLSIAESGGVVNNGTIYNYGTISTIGNISGNGAIHPQIGNENPILHLSGTSVYLQVNASGDKQISYDNSTWQNYTGTVILTGSAKENLIQVQNGEHDIILNDLKIDASDVGGISPISIQNSAVVNITLEGTNTLISSTEAGLLVEVSATLNITSASSGSLYAKGGSGDAGIGSNSGSAGGTIKIAGGTVTATGGEVTNSGTFGGMGIGDGQGNVTGGTLEISGGTVTATGGSGAQAFTTNHSYTLPTSSDGQLYSVAVVAGATQSSATQRAISEDYLTGLSYAKIAMSPATPQINITKSSDLTYNGTQQTQNVAVKLGGVSLTENTHYTLSGNTAKNAGDYTLTANIALGVNGGYDPTAGVNYIGNGGTHTVNYTIERATLTFTGATAQSKVYDGITDATADVSFGGLANGETLVKDIDYTVSANFPSPNVGDNLTVGGVVQLTTTTLASNYIFASAEFSFPTTASITPLAPPSVTPETGDNFNPVLWISIATISLGGVLVFVRKKLVK